MSYEYRGDEPDLREEFEDEERKPRFWVSALGFVALAAIGSGAAFAWHGYNGILFAASSDASTPPKVAAPQEALLKSLTEAQQRATAIAQRNQELLQAQSGEIRQLSETVSRLATRVDAMAGRSAQAAILPPVPKKTAPKVVAPKHSAPVPLPPQEKP